MSNQTPPFQGRHDRLPPEGNTKHIWPVELNQLAWEEISSDSHPRPRIAIGTHVSGDGVIEHGELYINWYEGYLESLPDGMVNLASTESKGVRYRFCVERVKEGE